MIPRPPDEMLRLAALHRYLLLDTQVEADFDLLTELAAELCDAPYSFVSLVDAERVWYKSRYGDRKTVQTPRDQDYCAWTILEQQEMVIPDLTADVRTADLDATVKGPQFRMYGGVNLVSNDGYRVGVLCVLDTRKRQLTQRQVELLRRLARQVVALMELRVMDLELKAALLKVSRLANEDELTGLRNRRAWMEDARQQLQLSHRLGTPLSLLMLDVDHFKKINDSHGHPAGDAVLRALGQLLPRALRATDIAGRLGGEEFAVLLPGSDAVGAQRIAENLRMAIEQEPVPNAQEVLRVTVSIGISQAVAVGQPQGLDALVRSADAALYAAKQAGRNRVASAVTR